MLVQKNSTILNFIFRWVYLENIAAVTEKILSHLYCYCCNWLCGNFAPESRFRIYSMAFILWHFGVFLLREGTCTTPISSCVKLPLSPLLHYFLCSSGIPPSTPLFHFIIVEFTGITVVGNWGKSVIWRRLSPQGHIFWRYELLVKPQPSYQTRSASSGCCCDVHSQILQAAHLLCCVPIKVLLCAVSFLNMH